MEDLGRQPPRVRFEDLERAQDAAERRVELDFGELEILGAQAPAESAGPAYDADVFVRDLVGRIAAQHGRAADVTLDLHAGTVAVPDRWLARLVTELLDNAFKFSTPGSSVRVVTRAGAGLELCVEDEGRGMTGDEIGVIGAFTQFNRVQFEQQGVGLGLYLARRIAELHRGVLNVQSRPGAGTIVTAVLSPARATAGT